MGNKLEYYMSLPYEIVVKELNEEEGGGVFLSIPQLGAAAVNAHGEKYEEARLLLENVKRDYFEIWLKEGASIPEPQNDNEKDYSGKLVLRMGRTLHATLAAKAEVEGISINTLITNLLNFAIAGKDAFEEAAKAVASQYSEVTHIHYLAKTPPESQMKMIQATQEAQQENYEACA
jgi:antitoxin HicB